MSVGDDYATYGVAQALRDIRSASESARPDLTVEQILAWADAHRAATGAWPDVRLMVGLGPVEGAPGETWKAINFALALGLRGLPGDSSLAELLAQKRGAPALDQSPRGLAEKLWTWEQEHFPVKKPRLRPAGKPSPPPLSIEAILAWADAHHAATGAWPITKAGPVKDAPLDVTWTAISQALAKGSRGLPGGSSLPRLLAEHRGVRYDAFQPPLSIEEILVWADAHHAATGAWPVVKAGTVRAAPFDVTWCAINSALSLGRRGLPRGSSLPRLLAEQRGARNEHSRKPLSVEQILVWADAHHAARGEWPTRKSGTVLGSAGETWRSISGHLLTGGRGLTKGQSLSRLLAERRGVVRYLFDVSLTVDQILAWADAHHAATGRWPGRASGPVIGAPGEKWPNIDAYLRKGRRGLPGGISLARLLEQHRGCRSRGKPAALSPVQVLAWADAHHAAHGRWPSNRSGHVTGALHGETWKAIDCALTKGYRGFPGGSSLARFLAVHRHVALRSGRRARR